MLNKWNFEVERFVSRKESRYSMTAIQVTPQGTCATNGHYLVQVDAPKVEAGVAAFPAIEGVPSEQYTDTFQPFLLKGEKAKDIAKALKAPGKNSVPILDNAVVAMNGEGVPKVVAMTDLEIPRVWAQPQDGIGKFPSVDAVIPKEKPAFEIGVNAEYLEMVAKFAKQFAQAGKGRAPLVKLSFFGESKTPETPSNGMVIRFDVDNQETGQHGMMLLMPRRF